MPKETKDTCSFCSLGKDRIKVLIESDSAAICAGCIISFEGELDQMTRRPDDGVEITPKSIMAYLNEHVVGQDVPKQVLAVAAYNHFKRAFGKLSAPVQKSNIWIVGPSGTGKTLLISKLAKFLDIPFASVDSTTLTEAGYYGEDPDVVLSRLLTSAKGDIEEAQKGIVFIDEFDKLAKSSTSSGRDIRGAGVQQSFLRMIEGDEVAINPTGRKKNQQDPIEIIDTSNILFVLGGAFVGMKEEQLKGKIGMERTKETEPKPIDPEDLITYGMIPEIVGRVPIIAELSPLTRDELVRILTEPKDALVQQYQTLFAADGVRLRLTQEFLEAVADKAILNGTGARGLRAIMERALLPHMFAAPDHGWIEKNRIRVMTDLVLDADSVK